MKLLPPSSQDNFNRNAVFWALLSQSIWLPVLILGSQDKWSTKNSDFHFFSASQRSLQAYNGGRFKPTSRSLALGAVQSQIQNQTARNDSGILLNSVFTGHQQPPFETSRTIGTASSPIAAPVGPPPASQYEQNRETSVHLNEAAISGFKRLQTNRLGSVNYIQRMYSRSELLGGTLTLQELSEPSMPPIARAERAQWSRSSDPLAPLPQMWREPMRQALNSLAHSVGSAKTDRVDRPNEKIRLELDQARFIHVPSSKIRHASEVPLALQADGTVDILNQPDDPAIIEEINRWSAKQKLPAKGKISPAVIHLHPMEPLESTQTSSRQTVTTTSQQPAIRPQQKTSEAVTPPLQSPPSSNASSAPTTSGNLPSASGAVAPAVPISSAAPQPSVNADNPVPPGAAES